MARKYSNEAYVYWFYNKYNFKTYFGSRVKYEGSYKDDFMINYNSSSSDEEFLKALENGELVGEIIAVFTGEIYKEVGKRAVAYENDLIELYWNNVGKEHSYNRYANGKFNNIGRKATENDPKQSKNVLQYTLDGEFIAEWPSIGEVQRQLKISRGNICSCCKGERPHTNGFIWKYKEDKEYPLKLNYKVEKRINKKVLQYDLNGNFIAEYPSIYSAIKITSIPHIYCCCIGKRNKAGGYIWKFKEVC